MKNHRNVNRHDEECGDLYCPRCVVERTFTCITIYTRIVVRSENHTPMVIDFFELAYITSTL